MEDKIPWDISDQIMPWERQEVQLKNVEFINGVFIKEGGDKKMAKSLDDLKAKATGGRTLTDLKSIDTSPRITFKPKTYVIEGKVLTEEGAFEPIEGKLVTVDWVEKTFPNKTTGEPEVKTMFQYFFDQGGRIRPLESGSIPLKTAMESNPDFMGKVIRIIRSAPGGDFKKTQYRVEIVSD
jgi:hypothetical protein